MATDIKDRGTMSVSWQRPLSDGGSSITDYVVEKQDMATSGWTKVAGVSSGKLSCSVSYLIDGTDYRFRVTARNKVGSSEPAMGPVVTMKSPLSGEFGFMLRQRILLGCVY